MFCRDASSRSVSLRRTRSTSPCHTYGADLPGQAFDVTKLRNGRYHLRTEANPLASLTESTTANNVAIRTIRLKGRGKRRRVDVVPWNGIRR